MARARSRQAPASLTPPPRQSAYVAGLRLLAGRELFTSQLRERLLRRGHDPDDVHLALERLSAERALDDARAADAWARTGVAKRKGRTRIARELSAAGVEKALVDAAIAHAFADVDDETLLAEALARRLRGRPLGTDPKTARRMYRYLVAQGFAPGAVIRVLKRPFDRIGHHDVE